MMAPMLEPNPITAVAAPPTSMASNDEPVLLANPVIAGSIFSNMNPMTIDNAIKPIPTFIAD